MRLVLGLLGLLSSGFGVFSLVRAIEVIVAVTSYPSLLRTVGRGTALFGPPSVWPAIAFGVVTVIFFAAAAFLVVLAMRPKPRKPLSATRLHYTGRRRGR